MLSLFIEGAGALKLPEVASLRTRQFIGNKEGIVVSGSGYMEQHLLNLAKVVNNNRPQRALK